MIDEERQQELDLRETGPVKRVEDYKFEPIRGFPMLHWAGKRPFSSTQYYPAQHKETHGPEVDGWRNKIYWGDNLQVMSHLLKEYRGKVKLVYIDPPFDSKADYKRIIKIRGGSLANDQSIFEEKQYTDLWANDDYLQFMYERLILIRELLSTDGSLYLHCDWHKSHYLRLILNEIFGPNNFRNEITWVRSTNPKGSQHAATRYDVFTDSILFYVKSDGSHLNIEKIRVTLTPEELKEKYYRQDNSGPYYDGPIESTEAMGPRPNLVYEYNGYTPGAAGWRLSYDKLVVLDKRGNLGWTSNGKPFRKLRPEDDRGKPIGNFWNDISLINSQADERIGYPTQKPKKLLERIILASSESDDLVFDCFMGSGTTQEMAMRLGRRFIGADINLGAIQITTKRLLSTATMLHAKPLTLGLDEEDLTTFYTGFEVYNVNNYDIFRNPVQARDLLIQALEVNPLSPGSLFDGEKDGRMVKIMPINRIATRQDLNELITGLDYKAFERRQAENVNKPVEKITLVCMGHEPDLAAHLQHEVDPYKLDIEVVDILRDKQDLQFKRDSEAKIAIRDGYLVIDKFYPMNLLAKLSLQQELVEDWRELVDSIMVDWNYDGAVLQPAVIDVPEGKELVVGRYRVPDDAGTIRVKITDLLSESLEMELVYG